MSDPTARSGAAGPADPTHPAGPADAVVRRELELNGVVQGVGMRPFLAGLAADLGLAGECRNTTSGVLVQVQGPPHQVAAFVRRVRQHPPPLAVIDEIHEREQAPTAERAFRIRRSAPDPAARTLVAADTATCPDCLRELFDPADRRYRHPFITCTNCGPRLSIVEDLPYDRAATTLRHFPMCPACADEYADPLARRFHAEPISCHDCGPRVTLLDGAGAVLEHDTETVLSVVVAALADGAVVAVKGLGGYHLACRADDPRAVGTLRARKERPHQPFAVLAADLDTAARVVQLGQTARALLTSPAAPIVVAPRRADDADRVCDLVAPGLAELGILLPYTPLHHLLARDSGRLLVLTSANRTGEPLCHDDDDALARLRGVADLFLTHDRPIAVPCEDSVVMLDHAGQGTLVRRSRGYAPVPLRLAPAGDRRVVLAAGADLKNTVTLVRDGLAFVSPHVGDLQSLPGRLAHAQVAGQLERFHDAVPQLLAADQHPGYASRAWAMARGTDLGVDVLSVQHHHAHLAALAAEHGRWGEPLLGLVFDGTGYGCDRTVWGGELLLTDGSGRCHRIGHLATWPLPGGDAGVRNPVRQAAAALVAAGLGLTPGSPCTDALTDPERALVTQLARTPAGSVPTSSVGRLFDVVSALLGVRQRISYEAQAAIELEALATRWARAHGVWPPAAAPGPPPLGMPAAPDPHTGVVLLDPRPLIRELDAAVRGGAAEDRSAAGELAWRFHAGLAESAAEMVTLAGGSADPATDRARRLGPVGLSGGVFQNRLLTALVVAALARRDRTALTHRVVPPNDGGLSLGQAAVALAHLGGRPPAAGTGIPQRTFPAPGPPT